MKKSIITPGRPPFEEKPRSAPLTVILAVLVTALCARCLVVLCGLALRP